MVSITRNLDRLLAFLSLFCKQVLVQKSGKSILLKRSIQKNRIRCYVVRLLIIRVLLVKLVSFFDRIIHGFEGWNIFSVRSNLFLYLVNAEVRVYKYIKADLVFYQESIQLCLIASSLLSRLFFWKYIDV